MTIGFRDIKLIISDFDGVMTDNRVLVDEKGDESVFCSRSDGLGVELLRKRTGVRMLVLSSETGGTVRARCRKLAIPCISGAADKRRRFLGELARRRLDAARVCFIGNDVNDIECMRAAGLAVAVADAHPAVLAEADYVTRRRGGEGAVREVIDLILKSRPRRA